MHMAMYTVVSGDWPSLGCSRLSLGGHRPRGGSAIGQGVTVPPRTPPSRPPLPVTATGVAVHRHKGGGVLRAATQARLRLLFFTFFTTFANVLTLQVFHHHVQVC